MTNRASELGNMKPELLIKRGEKKTFPKPPLASDQSFYNMLFQISLITIFILLVIFGWNFYNRTHQALPPSFAVMKNNELVRLRSLSLPNLTNRVLLDWCAQAATAIYTFDFFNYPQIIQGARIYFTKTGYDNFLSALEKAGTISKVIEKKLVLSSVLTDSPVVLKEGPTAEGTYAWQVQFPMLLTFQSASEQQKLNVMLTLLVVRVPTLESPKGIGITSFSIQNYNRAK